MSNTNKKTTFKDVSLQQFTHRLMMRNNQLKILFEKKGEKGQFN